MDTGFLEGIPLGAVAAGCVVAFLIAAEAGYRLGSVAAGREGKGTVTELGTTTGGLLGLLGLLLAFTFGMAGARYEDRKTLVIEEANAIGTAWLRTDLVPEPMRTQARDALRAYTDARLQGVAGGDRVQVEAAIVRSEQLQGPLWNAAVAAAAAAPTPPSALLVSAVNEVIDMHGRRVARSIRNPIPQVILWTLLAVAILVLALLGFGRGVAGDRSPMSTTVLAVVLSVVFGLILDLDRPRSGYLTVSQQAMRDVRTMMGPAP
jgi:hypothetical protein